MFLINLLKCLDRGTHYEILTVNDRLRIQWKLIFAIVIRWFRVRLWVGCLSVIIDAIALLMDVFNGCSLIQLEKQIGSEKNK